MRLITFNLSLLPFLWRPYKRMRIFSRQKEVTNTDVINLQEVYSYDSLLRLQQLLPTFTYVSYKAGLFGPRSGLVTFSRIPLHTASFARLGVRKGALISETSVGVIIANVHLIANTDGDWSKNNHFYTRQKLQLIRLNDVLREQNIASREIVLSGDFNIAKTSELYTQFVNDGKWHDATRNDFYPTFHAHFLPAGREPQRIDYIFTRGRVGIVDASLIFKERVNGIHLSNHLGLMADLKEK